MFRYALRSAIFIFYIKALFSPVFCLLLPFIIICFVDLGFCSNNTPMMDYNPFYLPHFLRVLPLRISTCYIRETYLAFIVRSRLLLAHFLLNASFFRFFNERLFEGRCAFNMVIDTSCIKPSSYPIFYYVWLFLNLISHMVLPV